jgi:hypothetical protein
METPKTEYQPGEGSDPVTPAPEDYLVEETPPDVVEEEGSGDYVEDKDAAEEADESYAKHRTENRGE